MAESNDNITIGSTMMEIVETDYESVFSWHIKEQTGAKQNLMMNFLDTIREKRDSVITEKGVFNMNRFYYQLIVVYELYILGHLDKSLQEVEILVELIDSCKFDEINNQYSAAYKHIANSTFAYIALSLNRYSYKIMENVKPTNILNQAEKSAICALKACVFMEYAPNGNAIAFKLADEARNLNSNEPHWIIIWLKAKGRIRRFNNIGKTMPDRDEIEAADILSSQTNPKPQYLINACKIYHDVAVFNKIINNKEKSLMYFKLGSDLLIDASKLINDDVKDLCSCLFAFLFAPKEFQSKAAINQMVEKLKTVNKNNAVYDVLGEYYLKYEKDYEKARMYFSRGLSGGQFRCAMQLLKVDCLLNSVDSFKYIDTLKMIYEVFPSPKRRLIILTQMLMYYYDTENPKELLHSLKLFLDQDINDTLKKEQLINSQSFYNLRKEVRHKQFLNVLTDYVDYVRKHFEWNAEEKIAVDETCKQFSKISSVRINKNHFYEPNKTNFDQKCYEWRLWRTEKKYSNSNTNVQYNETRNNETSWRKKKGNDNEATVYNPFTSNADKTFRKHKSQKNDLVKYRKEKPEDNVNELLVKKFNKHLTICNSSETEIKPNRLKNQHENHSNFRVQNSKNDCLLNETETKMNKKNKHQNRHWMAKQNSKNNIQEQEKKSSLPNISKVPSSPSHFKVSNKNISRSNNEKIVFKDEHNFVTSKLDRQLKPARNMCAQTKQH